MIDVISVANMRQSDSDTIASGVPGITLMIRAAEGIYLAYGGWENAKKITIVTGSGNNGGDGFALAVIFREHGIEPQILTLSDRTTPDSQFYKDRCTELGVRMMSFDPTELTGSDIIVDCMLGTGFAGTPREDYANAINAINSTNAYVISADINSGMNGDTGEYDICVRSDLTVTIGYLKKGLITARASEAIGKISVADIGIALSCKEDTADDKKLGIETVISRR